MDEVATPSVPVFRTYAPLVGQFPLRAAVVVAVLTLAGLFEAVGVMALLPMLSGQLGNDDSTVTSLTRHLSSNDTTLAWIGLWAVIGFGVLSVALRAFGERLLFWFMALAENRVRADLAGALLRVRWPSVHAIGLGETSASLMVATGKIGGGVSSLVQAFSNTLVTVPFVVGAVLISPTLTILTLASAGAALGTYRLVARKATSRSAELNDAANALGTEITETFGHLKYFRSSGMLDRFADRLLSTFQAYDTASFRAVSSGLTSRAAYELAGLAMVGVVLGTTIASTGGVSGSTLVLLALFFRLSPRLQSIQSQLHQARLGVVWLQQVRSRTGEARALADDPPGDAIVTFEKELALCNVSFRYTHNTPDVVSEIDLRVSPGECVAIVGPSGGGKTTILDLITGLLRPTAGEILVDGVPLSTANLEAWRRQIGVVLQDSPVFHDTAARNIGLDDESPDPARVAAAIQMAHAGFVDGLQHGVDTVLGERGSILSGGQRQRIAIARALYRSPRLLILDEATSALDAESEAAVQETLESLHGTVAVVLVAHRLATVKIADRIVVMEHGRAVETGTWDALSGNPSSRFRTLLEAQRLSDTDLVTNP